MRLFDYYKSMSSSSYQIKVIVAGGRDFADKELLFSKLDKILVSYHARDILIISGCAKGADLFAIDYAKHRSIDYVECPADWEAHGKRAGFLRNTLMSTLATHLIAFFDGRSPGTSMMIDIASKAHLVTRVIRY